jgi:hypothetical protein
MIDGFVNVCTLGKNPRIPDLRFEVTEFAVRIFLSMSQRDGCGPNLEISCTFADVYSLLLVHPSLELSNQNEVTDF